MNKKLKYLYIIAALILPALVMMAVEYGAEQSGLELRTFVQGIKGIYLWLAMPLGILYTVNVLVRNQLDERKENPKAFHLVRRISALILTMVIFLLAFFRGMFYVFSTEMVEETRIPDGYLKGIWSGFPSESHTSYYEVVAGIFRKPFPGWNRQQLTDKVQGKYGTEAEYVKEQPDGLHVFRLPDHIAPGEYIYFHVSDSYEMQNNGYYQILLSEAGHFWENRNRWVAYGFGEDTSIEVVKDTGEELESLPQEINLYISCYDTEEDIAACAADMTDWMQFVKKSGQYPYGIENYADNLLTLVHVGRGEDHFLFNMGPVDEVMGDRTWEEQYNRMKEKLSENFREHRENKEAYAELLGQQEEAASGAESAGNGAGSSAGDGAENSWESQEWNFMDTYKGDFEKECQVGDGQIRYRMVVEDAALGSRFYGLLKSTDGGESWQMSNPDPFDQQMGQGIDFTFLDERLGFATLMHNGGDEADLYVTRDGGESYQKVVMEGYIVSLENGFTYNPYDYPQMPYVEGSVIYMLCGQGADGDYNGGDRAGLALYQSTDGGYTFSFVEIKTSS